MTDEKKHYRMKLDTGYYHVTVPKPAAWAWLLRRVKRMMSYTQRAGKRKRNADDGHMRIANEVRKEIKRGSSEAEAKQKTAQLLGFNIKTVRRAWQKYK
jgi:hypothetical protein